MVVIGTERVAVRIYLDACCLSRPFDDQNQDRIHIESEAILRILDHITAGHHQFIASDALKLEIIRTPGGEQKRRKLDILALCSHMVITDEALAQRAQFLRDLGFKDFDAYHLASAEFGLADIFLTTDDQFLNCAARNRAQLRVRVENPAKCLLELHP